MAWLRAFLRVSASVFVASTNKKVVDMADSLPMPIRVNDRNNATQLNAVLDLP
jgi:hypothetical protein